MLNVKGLAFAPTVMPGEERANDPGIPSNNSLTTLLHTLRALREFYIDGSTRLAMLAFDANVSYPFHSSLRNLYTDLEDTGSFDPAVLLNQLTKYTALEIFQQLVPVSRAGFTLQGPLESPRLPSIPPFLNIWRLHLSGSLSSTAMLPQLASYFPLITDLILEDHFDPRPPSQIFAYLDNLPNPQTLTTLKIWVDHSTSQAQGDMLARILTKFTSLTEVSLPGLPLNTIYPILSTLPLVCLTFNYNLQLSELEVAKLLSGTSKIKTLQSLDLNNVFALKGSWIPRDIDPAVVTDLLMRELGWISPQWTEIFSAESPAKLELLCKREGIEIGGTAIDAEDIEFERTVEIFNHARDWAGSEL